MSNLGILLKNNYNILLGQIQGKKKRKSTAVATYLLVFGIVAIFAFYTISAISMYDGLGAMGLGKLCVFHSCITTLAVLVILGTMRTSANQKNNDSDFLLSLPIKKRDIVISKTVSKYVFDFFFVLLLFAPYVVLYQIKCEFNLPMLLRGIALTLLLPLLSLGISYVLDFVIRRLFNRSRIGSLLKSVVLVFIFIVVMGFMLVTTSLYGTVQVSSMEEYMAQRPISNLFVKFMFEPNVLVVLIVLSMLVLPFAIGLFFFACDFGKTFSMFHSNKTELKFNEKSSGFSLLYKKELYGYASTTAYIVNTIIGPIIMIALSVFLAVTGKDGLVSLLGTELDSQYLGAILALIFCGLSATTVISSCSVSLEGKNIWLLKSSPIKISDIFNSKVLVHTVITEPFLILSTILVSIVFKLDALSIAMIVVLPTLHVAIMAYAGVLINLWQPNLNWDDETKVIKQSLSVLLTMALGIILTIIPFAIKKLFVNLSLSIIFAISTAIYVVVLIAILLTLFSKGRQMFDKL